MHTLARIATPDGDLVEIEQHDDCSLNIWQCFDDYHAPAPPVLMQFAPETVAGLKAAIGRARVPSQHAGWAPTQVPGGGMDQQEVVLVAADLSSLAGWIASYPARGLGLTQAQTRQIVDILMTDIVPRVSALTAFQRLRAAQVGEPVRRHPLLTVIDGDKSCAS